MINDSSSTRTGQPAVLAVVCLALFFGVLNGSAVAVVLPEIGADLGIADADLSWVLSGFLLTYGVAIPFYGRLANRFGARNLFLIGVTVFAIGSALSAIATDLPTLLGARTVQAAGGAAVPGLGMTLASRAFPDERRGFVLGIVSATMGVGAAAGPLVAGVISEIADWRALFGVSAISIVSVPLGFRLLDRNEIRNDEPLDLIGGALFGLGVASTLFFVTQGSQTSWTDAAALAAAGLGLAALITFSAHQRHSSAPFIPKSLLVNRSYITLTLLGFVITFANLAAQIGYPFAFNDLHAMSTLDIGIALIPAALTTAIVGVVAGRIVDRTGAAAPIRVGAILMVVATIGISSTVGSSSWTVALIAMAFAAGFALVNTPLAAVVSLLVNPKDLASALSLNTMMFFIGGSFGATLFSSIVLNTNPDNNAWNPLHDTVGAGFSNAFAVLAIPIGIGLALSVFLPSRSAAADNDTTSATQPADSEWIHHCELPWTPELETDHTPTTIGATMTDRTIATITGATPQPGSGILHPFPTRELPHIDPFVFLDTGTPRNIGHGDIYVGPHSHRGVQPVSLLFSGRIEHRDSLGNDRTVHSGGMQWLVAGSGALHEEVLNGDENGIFHMAQLWINVPAELKMNPPEHHAVTADNVPEFASLGTGAIVRLYAGDLDGQTGPAPMPTPVLVAHITLDPGGTITIPVPQGWTTAFTNVAGQLSADGRTLEAGDTPVFNDDGEQITVTSGTGGQLLLMCGEPIGEPIAMGGGFVMNTSEEIDAAFADDRSGRMGQLTATR